MNPIPWFSNLIREELARLYANSLEGCPGADTLEVTARSWIDDLHAHYQHAQLNQQTDEPRFRAAFRRVRTDCRRWPTLRDLIERVPARPSVKKLAHAATTKTAAERTLQILRDRELLGLNPLDIIPARSPAAELTAAKVGDELSTQAAAEQRRRFMEGGDL